MITKLNNQVNLIKKEALARNLKTALSITVTTHPFKDKWKIFPYREFEKFLCLPIGVKSDIVAVELIKFSDGKFDVIFVDVENKLKSCKNLFKKAFSVVKKSKIYPVKGNDFSADAAFSIVYTQLGTLSGKKICVIGAGNIGSKVGLKLVESGAKVFIINSTQHSTNRVTNAINSLKPVECTYKAIATTKKDLPYGLDCVIGFTRGIPVISKDLVLLIRKNGFILDGGSGTISLDGIKEAKKKQVKVLRLDIRMGFASYVNLMINSEKLISKITGIKKITDFNIIAGGIIGNLGDIVVDDISKPKKIFGVSDGKGGLLDDQISHKKNVKIVHEIIKANKKE